MLKGLFILKKCLGQRRARKQARLEEEKDRKKAIEAAAKEPKKETKEWVQAETEEGQTYYWHMLSGGGDFNLQNMKI